jgi:hypothetical protein
MSIDIIIAGSLFIIGLFFLTAFFWVQFIPDHDTGTGFFNNKKWKPNVPYTRLVSEIIQFTGPFLAERKIRTYPPFKICYYKHKKYAGVFNGEVVIYLKSNSDISSLVSTVLHEVAHYQQSKTDTQYKKYDALTASVGYWLNPFEIQARAFADQYAESCIKHLASKQLIVKE